ncbi:hypothetical protein AB0P02_15500 [Streptomyces griseoluteus]|uniref:hypothetical protein n=1 Tax=Streptomyces griseoluteus TaxID=29306 RepID=UPI00342FD931
MIPISEAELRDLPLLTAKAIEIVACGSRWAVSVFSRRFMAQRAMPGFFIKAPVCLPLTVKITPMDDPDFRWARGDSAASPHSLRDPHPSGPLRVERAADTPQCWS